MITSIALFDEDKQVTLHTRIAGTSDNIFYDLADHDWNVVHVTPGDWSVTNKLPPMFRRYAHQLPQVAPLPGGEIKKLLDFVAIKKHSFLFLCWVVCSFIDGFPIPIFVAYGEKGAAKTTTFELKKSLLDPSSLKTLSLTKDSRSLLVNLLEHHFLPFDNVSYIDEDTSDALCRAVTGGGIQHRRLYTDEESAIFSFRRVLGVNGINNVATRPDLLDRAILIELDRISESDRKELSVVQAEFETAKASILGGIFDTLAVAMKIYPNVKLDRLERMADFTRWGYSIGEALEDGGGERFLREYSENREAQNEEAVANDPVATLIVALMSEHSAWQGSAALLLKVLRNLAPNCGISVTTKSFPPDPTRLSKRLNGIRSNLENFGISFEKYKSNGVVGLRFTSMKKE